MFGLRPVTYAGSPSGEARQALRQGADEGCPFGGLCRVTGCRLRVSFRGLLQVLRPVADAVVSFQEQMKGLRPRMLQDVRPMADEGCPFCGQMQ